MTSHTTTVRSPNDAAEVVARAPSADAHGDPIVGRALVGTDAAPSRGEVR